MIHIKKEAAPMKGSGFMIVTILKFSTLWTEESFFFVVCLSTYTCSQTQSPTLPFTIDQIHFFNFHCPKKKKKNPNTAECNMHQKRGLTYSWQCKPNSRDRAAIELRVTDTILTEHPPQDITRDTFKCLHSFKKTHADWLSKLPRNL